MRPDVQTTKAAEDEINVALGTQVHYERFYWKELRDLCLGSWSKDLIPVSRFYPSLQPQVVVDFQPGPPEKFYLEEKRQFFMKRGIIYIPIYLEERLTLDQFKARYEEEKQVLVRGYREELEDKYLLTADEIDSQVLSDPQLIKEIETAALEEVQGLRGAAKLKRLGAVKARLIAEAKEKITHARMDDSRRDKPTSSLVGR